MSKKKTPTDLVPPAEAAKITGLSENTLRTMRWKGNGPTYYKKQDRSISYSKADLARFSARRGKLERVAA